MLKNIRIAILAPSFNKNKFDIICAPFHDKNKLKGCENLILFEGSLSKVSLDEPDQDLIMVAVGGKNNHYKFNDTNIVFQINYFISIHPNTTAIQEPSSSNRPST